MTKDEALLMAIEALAKCKEAYLAGPNWQKVGYDILDKSQQACKEALDHQEVGDAEIKQMLNDIEYYQKRVEALEQPPPEVEPFDVWAGTNPKRTYDDKDKVYIAINVMHKDKLIHLLRIQRNEDKKYYIELNDLIRFINMGNSKKEWQGLNPDEIQKCYEKNTGAWVGFYDQVEQALRNKNEN